MPVTFKRGKTSFTAVVTPSGAAVPSHPDWRYAAMQDAVVGRQAATQRLGDLAADREAQAISTFFSKPGQLIDRKSLHDCIVNTGRPKRKAIQRTCRGVNSRTGFNDAVISPD